MPNFKTSAFLICAILCMAGEQRKNVPASPIQTLNVVEEDLWMKKWKILDRAKLNYIGTKPLDEIQLTNEGSYIRFRKSHTFNGGEEVIEVIDTSDFSPILKYSVVSTDTDCHPLAEQSFTGPWCFNLDMQYQKFISSHEVEALMDLLLTSEFWELDQNVSEATRLNGYIYDGEDWQIDAKSAYFDYHKNSLVVLSHTVERQSIHRFESIRKIGDYMQELAVHKFVFP